jgi:hypothetical protein
MLRAMRADVRSAKRLGRRAGLRLAEVCSFPKQWHSVDSPLVRSVAYEVRRVSEKWLMKYQLPKQDLHPPRTGEEQ